MDYFIVSLLLVTEFESESEVMDRKRQREWLMIVVTMYVNCHLEFQLNVVAQSTICRYFTS